jgi:hypothetical protein
VIEKINEPSEVRTILIGNEEDIEENRQFP